jgi:choline/ethanolamine kinase
MRQQAYKEVLLHREFLVNVKSPVVFCHNDLQEGNILLRLDTHESRVSQPELVVIDFEFCSYNYRGFDFANHMCEWQYDYSNENPPYFWAWPDNCPSLKQQVCIDCEYLVGITTVRLHITVL